ncbi:tannase/feruloyl esterase family alpha/beta hydrolase [Actinocorallia sp. A-T 12471]|uniref:tannase/feruloyl esterase family alpha/beta hydrolase n=1 Tax=Actinocorallia sp. A-T 12471 TaxID=3089813 RepID=UPI0029D00A77|nr:tannase/feruloyl esterase family alpha/beta hydrolase [Actinocorallia sp. A-T 12471]MDX6742816.1 tannase/feruloyl esterase family alpha/beta hydrolase [Actinocorallia sp. A-T 12471]
MRGIFGPGDRRGPAARGRARAGSLVRVLAAVALLAASLSAWGDDPPEALPMTQPKGPSVTADGLLELPALTPVMHCAALVGLPLDGVTDAPAKITSATVTTKGRSAPYCSVRGTIAPANTIVLRLPVEGWTQRYVQTGCGGRCGRAVIAYGQADDCAPVRAGTLATATTDMGHQGRNDGSWADGDPQAQIDFAYRATHVTAQVAKAIITKFYGSPPAYSYFIGCSDGGREGLMEAQRYPDEFDGVVAGAPANNLLVQNFFHHGWSILANRDKRGDPILRAHRLPLLHKAVLNACDSLDGLADGVLDDPRRCDFDPWTLRCAPGQDRATCLTAAEIGAVQRLHAGAVDDKGVRLEPHVAHEWGSELGWSLFVPSRNGQSTYSERSVLAYGRYLGRTNVADPDWDLSDLKFTAETFWDLVRSSSYLSAMDPDLGEFQRSGGKLLLWHGWNDQYIAPRSTLAYYEAMRAAMGGQAVDAFTRLYLFPGLAHCAGGEGPNDFDVLTPMMAWVESGRAPGEIIATRQGDEPVTRPVYPYPAVARHDGKGDPDEAASFTSVTLPDEPLTDLEWLGRRLYSGDYQTTCEADDDELVCRPSDTWLSRSRPALEVQRTDSHDRLLPHIPLS